MHTDDPAPKAGFVSLPEKTLSRAVKALGSMTEASGKALTLDVMWRKTGR